MKQCLLCNTAACQAYKAIFTVKGVKGMAPSFTAYLCQDHYDRDSVTDDVRSHLEQVLGPFNKFRLRYMRLRRAFRCVRLDSRPLPTFIDLEPGALFYFNNWELQTRLCQKHKIYVTRYNPYGEDCPTWLTRGFPAARVIPAERVLTEDELTTLPDYVKAGSIDFTRGLPC